MHHNRNNDDTAHMFLFVRWGNYRRGDCMSDPVDCIAGTGGT